MFQNSLKTRCFEEGRTNKNLKQLKKDQRNIIRMKEDGLADGAFFYPMEFNFEWNLM
jgi:hypothetical protein